MTDDTATDGARIRTYDRPSGNVLTVVRFGRDGMVTAVSVGGSGTLIANGAELRALASDPELRF